MGKRAGASLVKGTLHSLKNFAQGKGITGAG
jgi:hypothetical protein